MALLAAGVLGGACAGAGSAGAVTTIRGNLLTVGASSADPDQPTAGTVEAHADRVDGPISGTGTAASDGIYQILVPAGTYYLSARVGRVICLADAPVTVTAQAGAKADVICTAP